MFQLPNECSVQGIGLGAGQKVPLQNVCRLSARLFSLGYSCLAALLASADVGFGIRDVVYQLL